MVFSFRITESGTGRRNSNGHVVQIRRFDFKAVIFWKRSDRPYLRQLMKVLFKKTNNNNIQEVKKDRLKTKKVI